MGLDALYIFAAFRIHKADKASVNVPIGGWFGLKHFDIDTKRQKPKPEFLILNRWTKNGVR